jgi:hypothetical protein
MNKRVSVDGKLCFAFSGGNLLGQGSSVNALCTVTFLEQQLAACRALNSKQEYHNWLLALARFLVQEGEFLLVFFRSNCFTTSIVLIENMNLISYVKGGM